MNDVGGTLCKAQRAVVAVCILGLVACSTQRPGGAANVTYPLDECPLEDKKPCVARLFRDDTLIATREPEGFPQYYLEIANPAVRDEYCGKYFKDSDYVKCQRRLQSVADYFNPNGPPDPKDLAVALEGGGSKAAPFALGVLAGLDELDLLQGRVKAIGSISGGSYAASYYYNRLYDLHYSHLNDPQVNRKDVVGDHVDWFRSCIPDYFSAHFNTTAEQRCDGAGPLPWCGETNACQAKHDDGEFAPNYRFLGQVWTNADLLRGATAGTLDTQSAWGLPEYANIGLLGTETLVTVPFHFVARTMFRWPMNSAPSKLAYKLGLEREYGYSPADWKAAGEKDVSHIRDTLESRRKDRTISGLAALTDPNAEIPPLQPPPPLWIIGATAPGKITGAEWLQAAARDPLRQQFEITPYGYGSGTYGYARQAPDAPFDFLGRNPSGLPILDAVVASAAFVDEDETLISTQPLHFLGTSALHFTNVTWFTEIPNFNVGGGTRLLENVTPWPLYLIDTNRLGKSPYIHLQDGGNSENSGIFPLLRRGYKRIIYAHGTQDDKAELASICHLKNQLELDGSYILVSPDLERLVKPAAGDGAPRHQGQPGPFRNYLDGLCSTEMDDTDLVAFDQNPKRDPDKRDPAVAKLYCARLGYAPPVSAPFEPCEEYRHQFNVSDAAASPSRNGARPRCDWYDRRMTEPGGPKPSFVPDQNLFFYWRSDTVLHFKVYRGDPLQCNGGDEPSKDVEPVSTVIAIVPGISLDEVKPQLDDGITASGKWGDFCGQADRIKLRIKQCVGPDGSLWSSGAQDRSAPSRGGIDGEGPGLSCTALAHLLEDPCDQNTPHPDFPQDNFVWMTLHDPYTTYAAYFDLGRHLVRRAMFCADHDNACRRD